MNLFCILTVLLLGIVVCQSAIAQEPTNPDTSPNPESIALETGEFLVKYPSEWSAKTNYQFSTGEEGLLILDDVNHVQLSIRHLEGEIEGYMVGESQYRDDLIRIHKSDCISGQESLDKYGYECSDFELLGWKSFPLNENTAHQITYSWKQTIQNATSDRVSMVTEIPAKEDVWVIYAETSLEKYPDYWSAITGIISSFEIKDVPEKQDSNVQSNQDDEQTIQESDNTGKPENLFLYVSLLAAGIATIALIMIKRRQTKHARINDMFRN